MKRVILLILVTSLLVIPVSAMDFTAPEAPDAAQKYMPSDTESFGEGLWYIIKAAIDYLNPGIAEASSVCVSLMAVALLIALFRNFSSDSNHIINLFGTVAVGFLLIRSTSSFIELGIQTVTELSEYGKMLLPVMTGALAAQGGATSSAALYAGTILFNSLLVTAITKLLIPMIYIYLCLSIANSAVKGELLDNLRNFIKWAMTWGLKIILYAFTGYITITGVVSGTADASAIKATKIAISGAVPVVGSILSDASEAILVSAGIMKSAAGIYGILAMIAVYIGPFLEIGIQYLLLKLSAAVCNVLGTKETGILVQDFSAAMGIILAMTGTVCLLHLISTVCFMKGVA